MSLYPLTAISPVDGRYHATTEPLAAYFSEQALMQYRVKVEIEYLIALTLGPQAVVKGLTEKNAESLRQLYQSFSPSDAQRIKEIEKTTNHDVKAVEYFLKEKLDQLSLSSMREWVHFGLTSQDINNTATPLLIRDYFTTHYVPALDTLIALLSEQEVAWKDIPMLARTHGQPASPTRLGKEIGVFAERLRQQKALLVAIPHAAKFGGATGNFNAHVVSFPETDWNAFAHHFVNTSLGLHRSHPTTQIEHYDHLAALLDGMSRINTILIDYCRDMWQYISMNYFRQKIKAGEVGSSAMPHKVNPIDFENAEGNLGLANALQHHLSSKLPISRLQRDLTDSTVLRNVGVPFAHTWIALHSIRKGISKLELNRSALDADLDANWAVVAEAIQTILRKEGYPNPYEALKELTRGNASITKESLSRFIDTLNVSTQVKDRLKSITPFNYTGI